MKEVTCPGGGGYKKTNFQGLHAHQAAKPGWSNTLGWNTVFAYSMQCANMKHSSPIGMLVSKGDGRGRWRTEMRRCVGEGSRGKEAPRRRAGVGRHECMVVWRLGRQAHTS